jgi:hypothetical protein
MKSDRSKIAVMNIEKDEEILGGLKQWYLKRRSNKCRSR